MAGGAVVQPFGQVLGVVLKNGSGDISSRRCQVISAGYCSIVRPRAVMTILPMPDSGRDSGGVLRRLVRLSSALRETRVH